MKKNLLISSLLAGCCLLGSNVVLAAETKQAAQNPQAIEEVDVTIISVPTLLERLNASGYSGVHKVTLEKDGYEVQGWDMQGRKFKLEVEAKSNHAPQAGSKAKLLTLLEVAQKVEQAGYTNISSMEVEKGKCEVKAHDNNGHRAKIFVDLETGAPSKG